MKPVVACLSEERKRQLTAFARRCIINSGGNPDAAQPTEQELFAPAEAAAEEREVTT